MSYKLEFVPSALKEWKKLGETVKAQLKKKLEKVLESPCIEKNRLSGVSHLYKLKLRSSGYRLVYEVDQGRIVVLVLSIGKRNRSEVYKKALSRVTS
jgi:mRNA interferase RelE/StbE